MGTPLHIAIELSSVWENSFCFINHTYCKRNFAFMHTKMSLKIRTIYY